MVSLGGIPDHVTKYEVILEGQRCKKYVYVFLEWISFLMHKYLMD
jgi:hypothetical protein